MGSEGFISVLGGMLLGSLLGVVIALAIKSIRKDKSFPGWPILVSAFLGGILPTVFHHF
jgi:ABC-type lipoprotein release transport system permease subunit